MPCSAELTPILGKPTNFTVPLFYWHVVGLAVTQLLTGNCQTQGTLPREDPEELREKL